MNIVLRISLLAGIIIYTTFILFMLKKKKLTLKYSILWLITAVVLLIIDIFPKLLNYISKILGIATPVNAIFVITIFFMLLIIISLTSIVSKQHSQIKMLIQNVSMLQKDIGDLKNKIK